MLARLTSENQITVPMDALSNVDATEYFEVTVENGQIILTPAEVSQARLVRESLNESGISEQDIDEAVSWARRE